MSSPVERSEPEPGGGGERSYRSVLLRVLAVQVAALLLLWLLQATYGS